MVRSGRQRRHRGYWKRRSAMARALLRWLLTLITERVFPWTKALLRWLVTLLMATSLISRNLAWDTVAAIGMNLLSSWIDSITFILFLIDVGEAPSPFSGYHVFWNFVWHLPEFRLWCFTTMTLIVWLVATTFFSEAKMRFISRLYLVSYMIIIYVLEMTTWGKKLCGIYEELLVSNLMAQWRNILLVKGVLKWLVTLSLAWSFFLSKQASSTVAAVITMHINSRCCGHLFDAVNQAPEEFSFSDPSLSLFTHQLPEIENQIRLSTIRAITVGIITTYFPSELMTTMALCYIVGVCAWLYYLFSVGPKSEGHGGPYRGNYDCPPHHPEKKTKGKGRPKKKNKK